MKGVKGTGMFHGGLQNAGESYCRRCLERGHRCMTTNIVDGKHTCVFCEDGVACPVIKRELELRKPVEDLPLKLAAPSARKKSEEKHPGPATSTESETTTMKTERQTCKFEGGCSNKINANNKLGLCKEHKGAAAAAKPARAKAQRTVKKAPKSTPPPPSRRATNGAAAVSDGVATICVTEAQLDRLYLALPLEDKAQIMTAHLLKEND